MKRPTDPVPNQPLSTAKAGAGLRLLVADDDPMQLELARLRLVQLGFEVATATGGVQALAMLRLGSFDALLSDVMMPQLDGYRLCAEIRRDPALAHVPVILVSSAYVETAAVEAARRMGASAFVVRTPDLAELIEALMKALGNYLS